MVHNFTQAEGGYNCGTLDIVTDRPTAESVTRNCPPDTCSVFRQTLKSHTMHNAKNDVVCSALPTVEERPGSLQEFFDSTKGGYNVTGQS